MSGVGEILSVMVGPMHRSTTECANSPVINQVHESISVRLPPPGPNSMSDIQQGICFFFNFNTGADSVLLYKSLNSLTPFTFSHIISLDADLMVLQWKYITEAFKTD